MSGHSIYTCQRRTERCELVSKLKQVGESADESSGDFNILMLSLTLSLTKIFIMVLLLRLPIIMII